MVSVARMTWLFLSPRKFLVMSQAPFKTLFLCTGNQARSLFAEFFLRSLQPDLFEVQSAGIAPAGVPHPMALQVLREDFHLDVSSARSKSWEEFRDVHFDLVITLCDQVHETCPDWPGQPVVALWSSPDPALTGGDEAEVHQAFWLVAEQIRRRVELFASLPFDKLDALSLVAETHAIGQSEDSTTA